MLARNHHTTSGLCCCNVCQACLQETDCTPKCLDDMQVVYLHTIFSLHQYQECPDQDGPHGTLLQHCYSNRLRCGHHFVFSYKIDNFNSWLGFLNRGSVIVIARLHAIYVHINSMRNHALMCKKRLMCLNADASCMMHMFENVVCSCRFNFFHRDFLITLAMFSPCGWTTHPRKECPSHFRSLGVRGKPQISPSQHARKFT